LPVDAGPFPLDQLLQGRYDYGRAEVRASHDAINKAVMFILI